MTTTLRKDNKVKHKKKRELAERPLKNEEPALHVNLYVFGRKDGWGGGLSVLA